MLTDTLADFPFARPLDGAARAALARRLTVVPVSAGQQVTGRGRCARAVYLVLSGEFLGAVAAVGGREILTDSFHRGRIFGEFAALDGGARVRGVRAEKPGALGRIDAADFEAWLADHPAAMRALLAELASQIRVLTDRLYEVAMHDAETRVRLHLVRAAIEAGVLEPGGRLAPSPSPSRIAGHVGATLAEVTAALARFEAAGLIALRDDGLVLCDPRGLEHGL